MGGQEGGPALHHAQIDGARHPLPQAGKLLPGLVGQLLHLDRPAQQEGPLLGELQVPLAPDKKLNAQLLLQGLDLVAQGRLAHVQLFRRPGDVQLPGHDSKVA